MDLGFKDVVLLLHPVLAVVLVFPIIGMVVRLAWQTRQRRLESGTGKSKIPPVVGQEHVKLGRWLTGVVVGIALLGLAPSMIETIGSDQIWSKDPFKVVFIGLIYIATIASLVFLYRARQRVWRGVFATLTGMGLILLGLQADTQGNPIVYRRDSEWFVSHFYIGILAVLLMIFSLAIVQEIYQDRTNRWRTAHIVLNCVALLLFVGQGMTGTRDLLEIPLSWQEQHLYQCDFANKKCPDPPKQSQAIDPKIHS